MGIFSGILFIVVWICGIALGYAIGNNSKKNNTMIIKEVSHCGFTPEQLERMDIWDIVRYTHNGEYDCVWSSMHTKRDADKRCKALNEDYHKNYGKYVVERNSCI